MAVRFLPEELVMIIHSDLLQRYGSTGITETKARELNLDYIAVINASPDKPGFMGGKLLVTKLVADRQSGRQNPAAD